MAVPSLADINNLLGVTVVDNYHNRILDHLHLTDPYDSLVPVGMWDPTRGLSQTVVRSTAELPTAFPGAGTALAQNDGTGNADLSATQIKFGRQTRDYSLAGWRFQTDTYQVSDFQHDFQALDFVSSQEQHLAEYQLQFISDWKRENLVGNIDYKVSITGSGALDFTAVTNTTARFGGLNSLHSTFPAAPLDWGHLDSFYRYLKRKGAHKYAVGRDSKNNPVFPIVLGPEICQALWQDTENIREQVKYFDPKSNLAVNGYGAAVRGFVPIVDHFIPRFKTNGSNGFTNLYPFTNETINSGGSGRRAINNVAYGKSGIGSGEATCELFYILTPALMEMHVRPRVGGRWGMQTYDMQNYQGDIKWINNPDMSSNPDGDKGFYSIQNFLAPKPGKTDMGIVGLSAILE